MKKIAIVTLLFCAGFMVKAQDYSWRITYDVSIPVGEFSDYISNASWRGIAVDNRWMMTDRVSVGFLFSWHTFYEKKSNMAFVNENGTFTAYGSQFRYLNAYTFQANVHYYLMEQGQINPWIGLGIGSAYSTQRTDLGFYSYSYEPWSFSLAPQIGIDVPLGMSTDFTLGVRYNWLMNNEDKATSDFSYIGINAGFKFSVF